LELPGQTKGVLKKGKTRGKVFEVCLGEERYGRENRWGGEGGPTHLGKLREASWLGLKKENKKRRSGLGKSEKRLKR